MHQQPDVESVVYQCSLDILKQLRTSHQPVQPGETEWLEKILWPFGIQMDEVALNSLVNRLVKAFKTAADPRADDVSGQLSATELAFPGSLDLVESILNNLPRSIPKNGNVEVLGQALAKLCI